MAKTAGRNFFTGDGPDGVIVSSMNIRYSIFLATFLALALPVISLASGDGAVEGDDERCINSRAIRRTDVIDDVNIVFYMRGSKIYLNTLPSACKGLSHERRFTYETFARSLCVLDKIKVLMDSGAGAYEGRACKLGRFQLVTEEDIVYLFEQRQKIPEAERVDPPPVEELIIDDAEND